MSANAPSIRYNPRDRATINDPLPVLRRLQDEDPIHWSDSLRSWIVTRYDDVRRVLNDRDISADRLTPYYESLPGGQQERIRELIRYLNTWVAFKDPPEHTRLRKLMNKVFTPGAVGRLRPAIEDAVDHLLGEVEGRREFDFIREFAYPLPATVIMALLGLPLRDMERLKDWSTKMQSFIGSATASPDKHARAQEGAVEMAGYFRDVIREREREPGDDMISKLLAIRDEDEMLTEDEVIGTAMLFLFGGHETTTNLIGNGVRALLQHPRQLEKLRADPALIRKTVEEVLRYDGPTLSSVRLVKVEHERAGKRLRPGERVFVMIHAANHDHRRFERPDEFDIERDPNPHLTFNYGPHYCLGAPLARLEGEIAIAAVVERLPGLELAQPSYDYMDTMVMRGVYSMPVRRNGQR
jgi:cytochrome P450